MVVLVRGDTEISRWPLHTSPCSPALAVADQLARLQLVARRLGFTVRLLGAEAQLIELLALVGLSDVLPNDPLRKVGGETERGEQIGIDEIVVPDDQVT